MIPLNKIVISPKNVRKTPATDDQDAELYASIKETGLKQNLLVHKVGTKFHVHAGGRRLAALNKLAEENIIKPNHPIACSVEDPDQAEDTSAAENMIRAAMHAADQFEAFAALRKKGRSEDEIAKRFGITNDLVRRRLKLASVSPDLMQIFREGEMSLDCVMAFTLTDDHARQVEAWEVVKQHYNPSPHSIRNHLTQKSYSGSSKLALFVGIDAYKQAGGSVIEDLFSERDAMHLEDPDLLEKLAMDKLQGLVADATKIWKWAEACLDVDYDSFRPYGRIYPQPLDPDPKLAAEKTKLENRHAVLETDYDEQMWTEELQEEEDQIWKRIREIDEIEEANVAYTDGDYKIAGCIVSISHNGEARLETGLVRPADIPKPADTDVVDNAEGGSFSKGNNTLSGPAIELPAAMSRPDTPLNATDAARKAQGMPRSLADDLRATRHQIIRAHLAADYATAYDAMLYAMVTSVFGNYRRESPLDLSLRPATTTASRETLKDTVAERMLEALNDGLNIAWMEAKAPEDLAQLSALSEPDKQALFAWCAAYALNQQLSNDTGASAVIEAIGSRLNVDVAACWRPTADTYWGRVKKDHALDMAKALIDDRWADDKSGLRKAEIAKAMEQAFCDTPQEAAGLTAQAAAKTSRWLPDGMVVGEEAANQAKLNSVEVDADTLPAFMSDAA
ncbi:ParB N-terminal domain-containing protein [Sulfitobacter sp. M57]|uniref:ParB/RepB/Spo0J family partition protein n=1 Tax=unclassified Sulfitobacter TaxID=196795 RepID=UPI0023E27DCA|nr:MULTISPECIES: ParB/RepB/Spo0J family partition protein [unclassified Sulfitobacter]MDF3416429.1 ParB N-terminal domain-containing protein [Sulfitobacter sp. KE5]MDF3423909.1 ParB N-terminal domain-containing protein [Sulfitobacter sp. KE43]MDF3434975.1 ParB N-terminal domain-containing protein [Sulfitobacter sp. KE42]MDF3460614.1 ParB N-terminal domain-containing protein [Sulfitobacter sp. S74]MDF3464512.1 ParB N-terminal domain-containing protein [Sulfitobacter sp. Ks18]